MKIVVQELRPGLKIERRGGCLQKPECAIEYLNAARLQGHQRTEEAVLHGDNLTIHGKLAGCGVDSGCPADVEQAQA